MSSKPPAFSTPDNRYIVVKGRLWRKSSPYLSAADRDALVQDLMDARRVIKSAMALGDDEDLKKACAQVQAAKVTLGERGPVWWTDGAPDFNRHLVKNTPYADLIDLERSSVLVKK